MNMKKIMKEYIEKNYNFLLDIYYNYLDYVMLKFDYKNKFNILKKW